MSNVVADNSKGVIFSVLYKTRHKFFLFLFNKLQKK
jgi:hypothetical protein